MTYRADWEVETMVADDIDRTSKDGQKPEPAADLQPENWGDSDCAGYSCTESSLDPDRLSQLVPDLLSDYNVLAAAKLAGKIEAKTADSVLSAEKEKPEENKKASKTAGTSPESGTWSLSQFNPANLAADAIGTVSRTLFGGKAAEPIPADAEKYETLYTNQEGKIEEFQAGGKTYRYLGSSENGKDRYLVISDDDPEGNELNGSVTVKNGKVTVKDHDSGQSKDYYQEKRASSQASLYENTRQFTVATTKVFAGEKAAKTVDDAFKDPSKLQKWYADAVTAAQKAEAEKGKSKQQTDEPGSAKPAGDPDAGKAKPGGDADAGKAKGPGSSDAAQLKPDLKLQPTQTTNLVDGKIEGKLPAPLQTDAAIAKPIGSSSSVLPAADSGPTVSPAVEIKTQTGTGADARINSVSVEENPQSSNLPTNLLPRNLNELSQTARFISPLIEPLKSTLLPQTMPFLQASRIDWSKADSTISGTAIPASDIKSVKFNTGTEHSSSIRTKPEKLEDESNQRYLQFAASFKPELKAPDALVQRFPFLSGGTQLLRAQLELNAENKQVKVLDTKALNSESRLAGSLVASAEKQAALKTAAELKANPAETLRTLVLPGTNSKSEAHLSLTAVKPESLQSILVKTDSRISENLNAVKSHDTSFSTKAASQLPGQTSAFQSSPAKIAESKAQEVRVADGRATEVRQLNDTRLSPQTAKIIETAGNNGVKGIISADGQARADALAVSLRAVKAEPLTDANALSLNMTAGKRSQEGRYMIAELTLAMVLAAGGVRRILPSDRGGNSEGGNAEKQKSARIERQLESKLQEAARANNLRSFKLADLRALAAQRRGLQTVNLDSSKELLLSKNGQSFLRKFREEKLPLASKERPQPRTVNLSSAYLQPSLRQTAAMLPAGIEAAGHTAVPFFETPFERFLREQKQSLEQTLNPLLEAAGDFIEMGDPFSAFSGIAGGANTRKGRLESGGENGSAKNLERSSGTENNDDDDETPGLKKQVLVRPKWLIAEGETLVSIAEEHFSDPYLAWLIADLNKDKSREHTMDGKRIVEFQSRQQISLPVWQDIVEFYGSMPDQAKPENLVTIVSSSELDREVVDNVLRPILTTGSSVYKRATEEQAGSSRERVLSK